MASAWDEDRLVAEAQRLALRGLPRDEYHRELAARLRRTMAFDAACWHGLDPRTLMMTTANPEELLGERIIRPEIEGDVARLVVEGEYTGDDYNSFASLAGRRRPVGILSQAVRGRPERSARFREWLQPEGAPYEMRAVFRTRGRAWGCVVFHRREGSGDFGDREARLLARLSRTIAEGVRTSLQVDAARRAGEERTPGMILLGRGDDVEMITPPARTLLEALRLADNGSMAPVPMAVLAVAASARARGRAGAAPAAALHVPTAVGWLSLHASLPDGGRPGRVVVVVQRTRDGDAVPLRLEAHGLSDREREIATLVAGGLDTRAIAERLVLSPWTVQDHLKSIFEKTGTRSRRQLRAQIFHDEFLPAIMSGAPLDAHGTIVAGSAPGAA